MSSPDPQLTPFQQIGGQPVVDRIVDSFYDRMSTLPEARVIRALHSEDLSTIRVTLKKYLAQWLGGPPAYTEERGHPRLRARHLPFSIGDEERDAWMFCMRGAMEEFVTDQPV
ncbi:MAG TPA: group II truncated hemoglobin, partial [Steroidobacteraceae bacterium]